MSKGKAKRIRSLEADYQSMMFDLNRVGGGVPNLRDTLRGLVVTVDNSSPEEKRAKFFESLMANAGRITGAVDSKGNTVPGRFKIAPISKNKGIEGLLMLFFSREFVELERQAVATRAKIMTLKRGLTIRQIEPVGDKVPVTDRNLHPVGTETSWMGVIERVSILHRRQCIQLFNGANQEEVNNGNYTAWKIQPELLESMPDIAEQSFPDPAEIVTYMGELEVQGERMKQLIAVAHDEKLSVGHTLQ
ncbi:hypothetical protein JXD20_00820 [Candidatus Peregrinibacteria bacterium]|nr:hypothetical protein [Candidatus Peregrinibacteria bacterium]